jgi:hypothetical protein
VDRVQGERQSDHCQRFGNCLGLAIPARRMDHCFARLLQYLGASTKRSHRARDVGLGISSKLRRHRARHIMNSWCEAGATLCATPGGWSGRSGERGARRRGLRGERKAVVEAEDWEGRRSPAPCAPRRASWPAIVVSSSASSFTNSRFHSGLWDRFGLHSWRGEGAFVIVFQLGRLCGRRPQDVRGHRAVSPSRRLISRSRLRGFPHLLEQNIDIRVIHVLLGQSDSRF